MASVLVASTACGGYSGEGEDAWRSCVLRAETCGQGRKTV